MHINVYVETQLLVLHGWGKQFITYSISTAKKGVGQLSGSQQTPLGQHIIQAKIGEGQPINTVFVARRPTGEIYSSELAAVNSHRKDWILTRILWLKGMESGINRLGFVDSMRRYIYIHGTPDTEPMGVPLSHGCIRMRNSDIIALFDKLDPGTPVNILMH